MLVTQKFQMAFICFLTFLMIGCATVGPDFETPSSKVNAEWIDKDNSNLKISDQKFHEWWKVFDDPVLNSFIESAYEENLTLQIAGLRVLEARTELGIAVGNLYPQEQQARGGATYNTLSEAGVDSAEGDLNFWDFDTGFDAAWELDFWGKFRRGIEAADAELLASLASYDDVLVSLIAEVANTYVIIRTFEERIKLAEENAAIQQRSLNIAETRHQSGVTTELDVQQAKTLLFNTRASIPQLQIGLRKAQHALSILIDRPPGELLSELKGANGIPIAPTEVVVDIPAELLRRRPDIRRAEFEAAAQSALIGVAEAELYPNFSIFGTIGVRASAGTNTTRSGKDGADELFNGSSLEFVGGPGFRWNIFNFGRIKNDVRSQDARFQQSVADYQETVLRAAAEVEDSIVGFLKSQEAEKHLHSSFSAASRSAELALIQYQEGVVDYQRVLDSDDSLLTQQDLWTQSRSEIARNLIATYKALGGGWEIREGKPLVPAEIQQQMQQRTDWGRLLDTEAIKASSPEEAKNKLRRPDW